MENVVKWGENIGEKEEMLGWGCRGVKEDWDGRTVSLRKTAEGQGLSSY